MRRITLQAPQPYRHHVTDAPTGKFLSAEEYFLGTVTDDIRWTKGGSVTIERMLKLRESIRAQITSGFLDIEDDDWRTACAVVNEPNLGQSVWAGDFARVAQPHTRSLLDAKEIPRKNDKLAEKPPPPAWIGTPPPDLEVTPPADG